MTHERNAVIELCAVRVEQEAKASANAAMSLRTKPCRDRRDEEDYEQMALKLDGQKNVLKTAADAIRSLKTNA